MKNDARVAAAIEILDSVLDGVPTEAALIRWTRSHRFAGSGDRHAIRDLVFDAVRNRRSYAAFGGAETGRGLMIGAARQQGIDPANWFTGDGYGPPPLSDDEATPRAPTLSDGERMNLPDWLVPLFREAMDHAESAAQHLCQRAPVALRVNRRKVPDSSALRRTLAQDGIETKAVETLDTALIVTDGARRIAQSAAYRDGLVELQDVSSQRVVARIPDIGPGPILDFCAGGGGKALALADRFDRQVFAHDADPARMNDLPARARRAGAQIERLADPRLGAPYDLILCDLPCSGSGAWRRSPDAKWAFSSNDLDELQIVQRKILTAATKLLSEGGRLVMATCSVLRSENEDLLAWYLDTHPGAQLEFEARDPISSDGDGFYTASVVPGSS